MPNLDAVRIRSVQPGDLNHLRDALSWSIHVPPGAEPPDRALLETPPFRRYVEGWGRPGDLGLLAESAAPREEPALLGAAWVQLFTRDEPGYGFVDEATPVLAIAVAPGMRGRGIGTRLLAGLVESVRDAGFRAISLSVDPENPAVRLYRRFGFRETDAPRLIAGDEHPCMLLRV